MSPHASGAPEPPAGGPLVLHDQPGCSRAKPGPASFEAPPPPASAASTSPSAATSAGESVGASLAAASPSAAASSPASGPASAGASVAASEPLSGTPASNEQPEMATYAHCLLTSSQRSVVQGFESSQSPTVAQVWQLSFCWPTHAPELHLSSSVQASPSSHAVLLVTA